MTCEGVRLDAYLDRELGPAERAEVESHIEACPRCARELERLAAASSAVRGWQPLPRAPTLRRAIVVLAAVAALVLLLVRGGPAPSRPDEVHRLRAGEIVRHSGVRTYLAESLAREARVAVGDTTFAARHAFFRIEENPMERRTKLAGGAVIATSIAVAIWWGTAEVTHRSGRTATLGPGEHVVEEPGATEEAATPRVIETPFDPATGFTGIVLDPRDNPVEGATIEVSASSEYVGRAPDAVARSGPDGRFECGPAAGSSFFVSARKTGVGAAGAQGFPRPGADLVLRLVPGARLEGRVHEGEKPVEGVLLTAQMAGGGWAFARAITDAEGRFVLDHLDTEEVWLWGRPPAHEEFSLRPPLKVGETTRIEIPVERAGILRGRVVDEEAGAPLDLVRVIYPHHPGRAARLLGEGWFEIPGAGQFGSTLRIQATGYPETQVFYPDGEKERVFRISRGRLLRVSVVDGDGRPVAGARVTAQPGWTPSHVQRGPGGTTDAEGRVDLQISYTQSHPQQPITPSNVELSATCDGYCGPNVTAEVGAAREIDVTLRLERGATIEGRVLDPRGQPAGGVRCSVGDLTTYTDRAGRFRILSIPPGIVELDVSAEACAGLRRPGIELRGGETFSVGDLALGEGAEISGRVVDAVGNPVMQYRIWLGRWPVLRWGRIDAQGGFTIKGLDPGAVYEGGVRAGGHYEPLQNVAAGARDLVVALKASARLEGRVTREDGGPVPIRIVVDCSPLAQRRGDSSPTISSFTDGTFRGTLPAGPYRLSVRGDEWLCAEPVEVEVAAGATTQATLVLRMGGRIEGRVQRPDATIGIAVEITPFGAGKPVAHVRVSADSTFAAGPLAAGRYVLTLTGVYRAGLRGGSQTVEVAPGRTTPSSLAVVGSGDLVVTGAKAGEELRLLDALGEPVPLAQMEWGRLAEQLPGVTREQMKPKVEHAFAHADAQGVWRRFELIPGTYRVVRGGDAVSVQIRPGETATLDLSR